MVYHHASGQSLLGSKGPRTTIDTLDQLREIFAGTFLDGRQLAVIDVLDTGQKAFAIKIAHDEVERAWRVARKNLFDTGRWPVVTMHFMPQGNGWQEKVKSADFFSRFSYDQAPNKNDVSPEGLIAAAGRCDPSVMLDKKKAWRSKWDSLEEELPHQLEDTARRYGSAPTQEQVKDALLHGKPIGTSNQLDEWLYYWELTQKGTPKSETARVATLEWFEPLPDDLIALLLFPTANSWETLAYINWYGTSDYGSEYYIALLKSWAEQFGAELVTHYGTMLQFFVSRPPTTPEQAWNLASQHDLAAPSMLARHGAYVRQHAFGLMNCNPYRWFLEERP